MKKIGNGGQLLYIFFFYDEKIYKMESEVSTGVGIFYWKVLLPGQKEI